MLCEKLNCLEGFYIDEEIDKNSASIILSKPGVIIDQKVSFQEKISP